MRRSTADRVSALMCIVLWAARHSALPKPHRSGTHCRRLPRIFMAWFMIGMTVFCHDHDRQGVR